MLWPAAPIGSSSPLQVRWPCGLELFCRGLVRACAAREFSPSVPARYDAAVEISVTAAAWPVGRRQFSLSPVPLLVAELALAIGFVLSSLPRRQFLASRHLAMVFTERLNPCRNGTMRVSATRAWRRGTGRPASTGVESP
jgi:hypothetical protein